MGVAVFTVVVKLVERAHCKLFRNSVLCHRPNRGSSSIRFSECGVGVGAQIQGIELVGQQL
jgi:hypothetical protein